MFINIRDEACRILHSLNPTEISGLIEYLNINQVTSLDLSKANLADNQAIALCEVLKKSTTLTTLESPILYGFSNQELIAFTASASIALTTSACYAYSCWRK